jgi:hypothetical protein
MMPGSLGFELQSAPTWLQEYTKELLQKSRALSAEKYQPLGQSTPEHVEAIKKEMDRLIDESRKVDKSDFIPFSVTGKSKPIHINPNDLEKIIRNEDFARKVYESTTGRHNISKRELEDLRQRAVQEYQFRLPEIQKLEKEGLKPEEGVRSGRLETLPTKPSGLDFRQLQEKRIPLEERRLKLSSEEEDIRKKIRDVRDQIHKTVSSHAQSFGHQGQITHNPAQLHKANQNLSNEFGKLSQQEKELEDVLKRTIDGRKGIESEIQVLSSKEKELPTIPGFTSPTSGGSSSDLFRRASIEREIRNLQKQRGLIAPMNEIHDRAISMLERGFDDDTMKLAADELRESRKHDELRSVEPLVKSSISGPSEEYMNKYVNDYTKDIRKALEDESEEQYLKDIAPKINMSFAQMGGFHSGARAKALRDSLAQQRTKLHRELAHLTGHARDKAMEHHELQKRREQSAADIMGRSVKSEKEGARNQAEALRHQAVTKHGMTQLDVAALGQVARAKQEQEQHEIDVARHEHQRQLLYPQEQLAREAALLSGLPPAPSQAFTGTLSAGPQPPNLYTIGAGALSSLASNFPQNQQRGLYKDGGSVRKYANGGAVGSEDIGHEIRKLIQEQRHADKEQLEHTSHYNPFESMLRHVGNEMLSNPGEDPLLSVGRGLSASIDHKDIVKQRAANLYDKIQNTRLNQYQVLAAFENMKHGQSMRQQQLGLQRDQLGFQRENSRARQQAVNQLSQIKASKFSGANKKPMSATDRKTEIEAKKDLMRSLRMKNEVDDLGKLVEKTSTGPIIGGIKSILPKTKVDNQIEVATNKLILDMHQGMKNIPRSEEFMKRIETTKPNRSNYREANEEALNLMREGANDVEENSISTLLSMGWTPEKIEKQFKIKVPEHLLGDSSQELEDLEDEGGDIINMIDPYGNPLQVPASEVQEALSSGATIG